MGTKLKIGDKIPNVTLNDQNAESVSLYEFTGMIPLVVYFYPADDTPGCTAEACTFRDHFEEFEVIGARVIGISSDSVKSHKQFASRYNLNFTLLSDPKKEAQKQFGVKRNLFGLLPGRVTFIFNKEGRLIKTFNSAIYPKKHIKEALDALRAEENNATLT